jgi:hypothetical protein
MVQTGLTSCFGIATWPVAPVSSGSSFHRPFGLIEREIRVEKSHESAACLAEIVFNFDGVLWAFEP